MDYEWRPCLKVNAITHWDNKVSTHFQSDIASTLPPISRALHSIRVCWLLQCAVAQNWWVKLSVSWSSFCKLMLPKMISHKDVIMHQHRGRSHRWGKHCLRTWALLTAQTARCERYNFITKSFWFGEKAAQVSGTQSGPNLINT